LARCSKASNESESGSTRVSISSRPWNSNSSALRSVRSPARCTSSSAGMTMFFFMLVAPCQPEPRLGRGSETRLHPGGAAGMEQVDRDERRGPAAPPGRLLLQPALKLAHLFLGLVARNAVALLHPADQVVTMAFR